METDRTRVLIIGTGPAGLTAAIYAARGDMAPMIVEGLQPGGQLTITTDVENFPGFEEGVSGPVLMETMKRQASRFGAVFVPGEVDRVDFSSRPFRVWAGDRAITADTVIVATGASARWLSIPGEQEYMGRGVSGCATCDGFFFRNKTITVVGGGDTALEEANFLARFGSKVYLVHRRDQLRASKIMQERTLANPKIEIIWNTVVKQVDGDGNRVNSLLLENVIDHTTRKHATDGFFVAIGHFPNTRVFKKHLEIDEGGYLKVDHFVRTSVPGIFAAGDVHDHLYRQAIVAAGMGCVASLEASRFLESGA